MVEFTQLFRHSQFGYLSINNNFTAFDNSIKYEIFRYFASFSLNMQTKYYKFLINSKILFPSKTSLKQKTFFKPLLNEIVDDTSSLSIGTNYRVNVDLSFLFKYISFGFYFSYEYLPLKYSLKVLDKNNNSYFFYRENIQQKQTISRYGIYFFLNKLNNKPYIGYYKERLNIKEGSNKTSSETDYLTFGVLF